MEVVAELKSLKCIAIAIVCKISRKEPIFNCSIYFTPPVAMSVSTYMYVLFKKYLLVMSLLMGTPKIFQKEVFSLR